MENCDVVAYNLVTITGWCWWWCRLDITSRPNGVCFQQSQPAVQ